MTDRQLDDLAHKIAAALQSAVAAAEGCCGAGDEATCRCSPVVVVCGCAGCGEAKAS